MKSNKETILTIAKKKTKHALTGFKPLPLEAVFQTLRWERGKS